MCVYSFLEVYVTPLRFAKYGVHIRERACKIRRENNSDRERERERVCIDIIMAKLGPDEIVGSIEITINGL